MSFKKRGEQSEGDSESIRTAILFIEHTGPEGKGYFFLGFRVWDTLLVSGSQSSPAQYLKGSKKVQGGAAAQSTGGRATALGCGVDTSAPVGWEGRNPARGLVWSFKI